MFVGLYVFAPPSFPSKGVLGEVATVCVLGVSIFTSFGVRGTTLQAVDTRRMRDERENINTYRKCTA